MPHGRIDSFDADAGKGFIQAEDGGDRVPFEQEAVHNRSMDYPVQPGEEVTYEVEGGKATKVDFIKPRGYG